MASSQANPWYPYRSVKRQNRSAMSMACGARREVGACLQFMAVERVGENLRLVVLHNRRQWSPEAMMGSDQVQHKVAVGSQAEDVHVRFRERDAGHFVAHPARVGSRMPANVRQRLGKRFIAHRQLDGVSTHELCLEARVHLAEIMQPAGELEVGQDPCRQTETSSDASGTTSYAVHMAAQRNTRPDHGTGLVRPRPLR